MNGPATNPTGTVYSALGSVSSVPKSVELTHHEASKRIGSIASGFRVAGYLVCGLMHMRAVKS